MKVNWATLENFANANNVNSLTYVSMGGSYRISLLYGAFALQCTIPITTPPSAAQTDFETNYLPSANQLVKQSVVTQFEMANLLLQAVSDDQATDPSTGIATISFLSPGTFNGTAVGSSGRYIDWGQGWFNPQDPMDMVKAINIIDTNGNLGVPPGTTVFTYHDTSAPLSQQGVRIPYKFGHAEIEPLGYYGFLPSEMTLEIVGVQRNPQENGRLFVNLFWGLQNNGN